MKNSSFSQSLWEKTAALPSFAPQNKDIRTDVLIIGGGIAGLLCAYFLNQAGVDCVVAEANRICSGITGKTTAKITSQHGLIYGKLLREFGTEQTAQYLKANQDGLEQYRRLCGALDCDFREQNSYVYAIDGREKLERETKALETIGFSAKLVDELPLPFPTAGAVCFEKQGQFHPLKFLALIAKDLHIHEQTKVLELKPDYAVTTRGKIRADQIIVTTHFPFLNKHGSYFMKLYQDRSYVLELDQIPALSGMYVDAEKTGLSFRSYGDRLLLGGGSHRTGKQGGGWKELEAVARHCYPSAKIGARWATQDCMSLDGVPYIGQYAGRTRKLYAATGFNKWGMTTSMAAATILTELVMGRQNPYGDVFSPSRTILRPQLALNLCESALHLLNPTVPRCPHMGCALTYNRQERSWDCPCHGSRFTEKGTLLDNPAAGDLRKPPGRK